MAEGYLPSPFISRRRSSYYNSLSFYYFLDLYFVRRFTSLTLLVFDYQNFSNQVRLNRHSPDVNRRAGRYSRFKSFFLLHIFIAGIAIIGTCGATSSLVEVTISMRSRCFLCSPNRKYEEELMKRRVITWSQCGRPTGNNCLLFWQWDDGICYESHTTSQHGGGYCQQGNKEHMS